MSADLSLFDIDSQMHELLAAWQESSPDQVEARTAELREYVDEVIRSVDPIRRYIRFCDSAEAEAREEAARQAERARMWGARRDRLKAFVLEFMQQWGWSHRKPRKFESPTGSLSLRPNGGQQALTITDAALVPDEYKRVRVSMPLPAWRMLLQRAGYEPDSEFETEVSNERIRAALAKPCPKCRGCGIVQSPDSESNCEGVECCPECNGAKTASVPGCRLEPRGESVVVK
jgi:hypothetical protein